MDRVFIEIGATAGFGYAELCELDATRVMEIGNGCLAKQGEMLEVFMDLAVMPVEAFSGGTTYQSKLVSKINRLVDAKIFVDAEEAAGIAEIEREMEEMYPWYADTKRLEKVWSEWGSAGVKRDETHGGHMMLPLGWKFS